MHKSVGFISVAGKSALSGSVSGSWAWVRRGLAAVALLAVAACGGERSASGTDVVVSGQAPTAGLTPGGTVVFRMTVENLGSNAAQDIKLVNQLGSFLVQTGLTCQASGGATCPSNLSAVMTVPSLPVGGRLVFEVSALVNVISSGTISNTLTATAPEDIGRLNNTATVTAEVVAAPASLGVTQDGAASVGAGGSTTFKVVVSNPGGGTVVSNVVLDWSVAAPFAVQGVTYTCTAIGDVPCPAAQTGASVMRFTLPTLGTGRTLNFVFTVPVQAEGRGNLVSTARVGADGDLDTVNNLSTLVTAAVDPRNGTYAVYAANGRPYQLTIDFDAGTYTMDGNGTSVAKAFAAETGGDWAVTGGGRLRVAQDLLVGAHSFDGVLLPYVAARDFATSLTGLAGVYNLMLRTTAADGAASTRVATARITGNTLQICQDDFEAYQIQTCPTGRLRSWLLTMEGDQARASDPAGTETFTLRVARSGGANLLLAASTSTLLGVSGQQFTIGTVENAGLIDAVARGPALMPNAAADWVQITLSGTADTYIAEGALIEDAAFLLPTTALDLTPPVAMLQATPTPKLGGATIWVMQGYPLVVAVGATRHADGQADASGLLQLAVP